MHPVWRAIARFILKGRIPILVVVGILTTFMWINRGRVIDQTFAKLVPEYDEEYQTYRNFKEEFGEDSNVIVIAVEGDLFELDFFNSMFELIEQYRSVEGVDQAIGPTHLYHLQRNDSLERFELARFISEKLESQAQLDSLKQDLENLPFYRGLLLDSAGTTSLIAVTVNQKVLDSHDKVRVFDDIIAFSKAFEQEHGVDFRYAGVPVLRVNITRSVSKEVFLFLGLALLVMAVTLVLFFRSASTVGMPLIVVGVVIIWSLGILGLFGYKITLITGVVPALITVIGIPNSVYLITKYHIEYRRTRNKILSLTRMIEKIGIVTVMTNATTAVGFSVLAFTDIQMLREFGVVAGLSVVTAFFISLLLIPIFFSFLPPPNRNQLKHLDRRGLNAFIRLLDKAVHHHRWAIYVVSILLFVASTIGLYRLKPVSYMMDDVPSDSELLSDLRFVEDRFQGVMPFEILIDTDRKRAAIKRSNLKKTVELQERLTSYSPISRTVSIADVTRYIRQVFFDGGKEDYVLPTRSEYDFIKLYLNNTSLKADRLSKALSDSNLQTIRISGNIRDIGSIEMGKLVDSIRTDLDDIFDPERYQTTITGTTKIFIRGNEYLIQNLLESLALAFFVIALIMGFLFKSLRIVIISLVPNFLPLLMVAGVMGYLGIALKPSSALVFSVAFGIAVDDSIHFLARYRLGLQMGNTVGEAISNSFKDTGVSMIYTSIILFFGFVIFTASSFGGTEALGLLASSTLAIAMFSNLFLLPALLLTFEPKSQELPGPLAHRAAQARSEKHDVSSQEES